MEGYNLCNSRSPTSKQNMQFLNLGYLEQLLSALFGPSHGSLRARTRAHVWVCVSWFVCVLAWFVCVLAWFVCVWMVCVCVLGFCVYMACVCVHGLCVCAWFVCACMVCVCVCVCT